jgi:hypothetical protein
MADTSMMTDDQIFSLIEEMLADNDIGLYPERHDNGADCFTCPACKRSTPIKGYAYGMESLDSGDHEPDCKAVRLARAIRDRSVLRQCSK